VREEDTSFFSESGALELQLLNPSPYNAASIASGIAPPWTAPTPGQPVDPSLVRIELPEDERTDENAMRILNLVGIRARRGREPGQGHDRPGQRHGAGRRRRADQPVRGRPQRTHDRHRQRGEDVSQPNPLAPGHHRTRRPQPRRSAARTAPPLQQVGGGATVSDLLQNLKTLGLTPAQLVSVFQALDQGGFLHATLEVR
jgi:hypothetical protein